MRVLWVLLMIAGVVVCGGLAVWSGVAIAEAGGGSLRDYRLPLILLLVAGACGAGIFMTPREFKETLTPDEPEEKPAAWIEEMRAQQERDKP